MKNYMTTEQQEIINKLNALHKRNEHDIYNEYDINHTVQLLKSAGTTIELEDKVERIEERGVADTLQNYKHAERNIRDIEKDIIEIERRLTEAKAELEKNKQEKALLEQLVATNFQDILHQMKEDRLEELNNIEYEYIYKVFKDSEFLNSNRWDFSSKVVIRCDMWRVEKGNHNNLTKMRRVFQLDWAERGKLVEELKKHNVEKIVIDPKIKTKKMESEFFIIGASTTSYSLF